MSRTNCRFLPVLAIAVTGLAISGCASSGPVQVELPEDARYTVAVAQIQQETNSFSQVPTTLREFEAMGLFYGPRVFAEGATKDTAIGGFLQALADHGDGEVRAVPILRAHANSGGPLERGLYDRFKAELVAGLKAIPRLDGVYLVLHGAMGVEGMRDPEGDLLEAVRSVVGPTVPVGVSHDLHANVTRRRVELATFIVGYKTNPHRDFYRTGYDAGKILADAVRGKVRPVMVMRKMRVLKGGGMNIDFLAPMDKVFKLLERLEKRAGVLSASFFPVHIWLDDEELGWSTLAVADGDAALAAAAADEVADLAWSIRAVPQGKSWTAKDAVAEAKKRWLARKTGAVVVCDVADCTSAGAPGENTAILAEILAQAPDLVSYVPIRDTEVALSLWGRPKGETVTVTVGGKLDARYSRALEFTGEIVAQGESEVGKTVVLRHRGVRLVVCELGPPVKSPKFYTSLGLGVWKADVIVVKNLFPFRYNFIAVNRKTLDVETPGASSVDVFSLDYRRIPRPIYPLDEVGSWRGE